MLKLFCMENIVDSATTPVKINNGISREDLVISILCPRTILIAHNTNRSIVKLATKANLLNWKNSVVVGKKNTGTKNANATTMSLETFSNMRVLLVDSFIC